MKYRVTIPVTYEITIRDDDYIYEARSKARLKGAVRELKKDLRSCLFPSGIGNGDWAIKMLVPDVTCLTIAPFKRKSRR